jgi:hypothetical protein
VKIPHYNITKEVKNSSSLLQVQTQTLYQIKNTQPSIDAMIEITRLRQKLFKTNALAYYHSKNSYDFKKYWSQNLLLIHSF